VWRQNTHKKSDRRKSTRPKWIYSQGFYFEPREGGEVRIFGCCNNNKQTKTNDKNQQSTKNQQKNFFELQNGHLYAYCCTYSCSYDCFLLHFKINIYMPIAVTYLSYDSISVPSANLKSGFRCVHTTTPIRTYLPPHVLLCLTRTIHTYLHTYFWPGSWISTVVRTYLHSPMYACSIYKIMIETKQGIKHEQIHRIIIIQIHKINSAMYKGKIK